MQCPHPGRLRLPRAALTPLHPDGYPGALSLSGVGEPILRVMDTRPTRSSPRYAHEAAVAFHVLDAVYRGRTTNLSRGGICAEVSVELLLGQEVEIDIELVFDDDAHSEPLRICGRVVWCTRVNNGNQVGLAFCHVQPEQAEFLAVFLRYLDQSKRDIERSKRDRVRASASVDERFSY
jgi:hypothetical protein